ncbi:MAG: hypothetical protein HY905_27325 [Deltaproteobacteria bacterium]|nr:hypothetical protein [Deltaproteobacteria bacterium]
MVSPIRTAGFSPRLELSSEPRPEGRGSVPEACLLLFLLAAGCDTGDVTSRVVATVYEDAVRCDATACVSEASGLPATGERLDVMGVLSGGASQYDPGLYVYAGGFRANGSFFELEIDLPAYAGEEARDIDASYREYLAGAPVFRSERVGGGISIVSLEGQDGPYAGEFDLLFTDPGPDGAVGSVDDRVRSLRIGSFTLSGREPESRPRPEYTWNDRVWVDVDVGVVIDDPAYDYQTGCDGSSPEGYSEGSGCEGDTSTDPGGGGGCEGDTTGDVGGGSGCSGDTTGNAGGGSGCSGDTGGGGGGCGGGGGGGCEGDAGPSGTVARGGGARRGNRALSASLPLLALVVTRSILRRRK